MKNILFLILAMFVFANTSFSQDLIITKSGDSLDCKITKVTNKFIHIDYIVNENKRSTIVNMNQVESYQMNAKPFQPDDNFAGVPSQGQEKNLRKSEESEESEEIISNRNSMKLTFAGGYSHLTAQSDKSLSQDILNYEKELRSGIHFTGSFAYFFNNGYSSSTGIGLKVNYMNTSHSASFLFQDPDDPDNIFFGTVSDDIGCLFIGPQIYSRYFLNGKNRSSFYFALGLGYSSYRNNAIFVVPLNIESATFAGDLNAGLDIYLDSNILLNLQSSYLLNSYSQLYVNGQSLKLSGNDVINNNFLNFSIGITVNIN